MANLPNHRLVAYLSVGLVALGLSGAYAQTLAPGITWANDGSDSGDLITAAATLGVAHPSGYPTYLLLARLFQLVPLGDLALRTNLLSAVAAVLAVLCVYGIVRQLAALPGDTSPHRSISPKQHAWQPRCAAGISAFALGLSPIFWSQAVIAEVYSLNALFVALIVLFTLRCMQQPTAGGWSDWRRALIGGLALGNHVTVALPVMIWLVTAGAMASPRERVRRVARCLLGIGIGLLIYAYLPLRAATHPAVNWGDPHDWAGFWWVVSGQPYRALAFGLPAGDLAGRVVAWANLLVQQFGWPGLGLGFFGLLYGGTRSRGLVWLTVLLAAAYSIFAITYNAADSYAYLIPVYCMFAIWIGLGVSVLLLWTARWRSSASPAMAALLLIGVLWRVPATTRMVDASQDRRAIDYATNVLETAPAHAIIIASSDRDIFSLWYYRDALGWRPDITVVADPLLRFAWYRAHLQEIYPELHVPEQPDGGWSKAIAQANPVSGPVCRTGLDGPVFLGCDRL
jgi:hypothetical protein